MYVYIIYMCLSCFYADRFPFVAISIAFLVDKQASQKYFADL